ncbi:hypothetical protein FZC74_14040 [Sutcliffiella horikoshii]|uniref:Uncharacterized protein n=1 Tax=Sutcliffiella horikoshii TaxID=79883 RepID=A0AA94WPV4_9BACI|nr:hypothetical protein [Sutcliffiella horikoshii]TYS58108.1 hypothetical protein FZC74_14040 [Sutcliffiella horikoshii]
MEGSWEGFLDIIDLNQDTRQKAELKTLIEFPLAQPKKYLLIGLFDCITCIYGSEKCIWWYEPSCINGKNIRNPYTKIISKADLKYLQGLWERIAGDYILFLPEEFNTKVDTIGEEEFIGVCLIKYSQLLLKTHDANEVLYLYLNE